MSGISTHVLDTARGRPAAGISISLEMREGSDWNQLAEATADENGRSGNLMPSGRSFERGTYRLRFDVVTYFRKQNVETFFAQVTVTFEVLNPAENYHVPLLLSPWGYTIYRGS
jgi:5-hydroxyisourate hydrolase